jgi:signal transduction histidine kinase
MVRATKTWRRSETLEGEDKSFDEHPEAARVLDERFAEIFQDYERRLHQIRSLLVVGDGTRPEQLEANARSVLGRAAKVLRGEERSLLAVEEEIYRNIETSEEPLNPHPDESFRAGVALCKAAVAAVVRDMARDAPPEEIAGVALAVQEIVMDRVSRMVMASYVDYLLTKVKETQYEERRRFSRVLQDRLAHDVAVVTQSLDLYQAYRERDPERAEGRLAMARESADEALGLMREYSRELKLSESTDGLRIALENLMRISVPDDVEWEVSVEGEEGHLPDYVRDQLYMTLREGVRNAAAHRGSERITVEVRVTPRRVAARVRDGGSGLHPEDGTTEGLGLSSMEERVSLVGGSFELVPESDGTARAELSLPLMRENDR